MPPERRDAPRRPRRGRSARERAVGRGPEHGPRGRTEASIDFRLVDLGDAVDLETLAWLVRSDLRERELAIRGQRVWAPRLVSLRERHARVPAGAEPTYRLTLENAGQIAGLGDEDPCELPTPGPRDVEIDVAAAALNFRDVMVTLGLLPVLAYERSALGREVGMEASGVVRRVGPEVRDFRIGDEVAFLQGGSIANRAVVHEQLVFAKPEALTLEEAASSLSVYVTAYYALVHLARLREGPAGSGPLGHGRSSGRPPSPWPGIQGRRLYATAGSEAKRARLRELGVRGAFDSHRFDWHDELMAATGGEGVDVVLNSLAGRHIELCLQAPAPGRMALRDRKGRHLRRFPARPADVPEKPALRRHRRRPPDGR